MMKRQENNTQSQNRPDHSVLDTSLPHSHIVLELEGRVKGLVNWTIDGQTIPQGQALNLGCLHIHAWQDAFFGFGNGGKQPEPIKHKVVAEVNGESVSWTITVK